MDCSNYSKVKITRKKYYQQIINPSGIIINISHYRDKLVDILFQLVSIYHVDKITRLLM